MGIRNALDRLIAAREKQARRYVNGALLGLDDSMLEKIGKRRDVIRQEGASTYPF